MKVTYNWLKDFVDIDIPADKLAERLTMAGLEVEAIEQKDGDFVYTIEITSNRPDWLSVMGIAREVAAITGRRLKPAAAPAPAGNPLEKIDIVIEEANDCPVYTGRLIRDVKVGASPEWMRKRLELVGVRSVNNIVDITNYVLFETGEPLHAFDLDTLRGGIVVRRARAGEKMIAIDGKEYALDPGVLVIADKERPVAIAGVMGGKDTEVSSRTKNVLLEAAVFNPVLIRRGRQKLALQSEASYRFERGVDPLAPVPASLRAAALIVEIAGGSVKGENSRGESGQKEKIVEIDPARICAFLGVEIETGDIERVLTSLGFAVTVKAAAISVAVPSFRQDIKAEIDLVEEIARVYGYNAIPSCLPAMAIQPAGKRNPVSLIKETLIGQGLDEVLTYSLIDRKFLADFYQGSDIVEVANPLSNEQEILRPVLIPSLAKCVAHNLNQRQPEVAVFEVAKTYRAPDKEYNVLGIAVSGAFSRWFGTQAGNVQFKAGFLQLKGILEVLFNRLGIDVNECRYEYRGSRLIDVVIKGEKRAELRKLNAQELALFDIKDKDVFLAEVSLDRLLPLATADRIFKAFSRFPWISRDITLELKEEIPVEKVLEAAKREGKGLMKEAVFLDYYDKNLPAGYKRVTISCVYSSDERTLAETEIAPVHQAVMNSLKSEFSSPLR